MGWPIGLKRHRWETHFQTDACLDCAWLRRWVENGPRGYVHVYKKAGAGTGQLGHTLAESLKFGWTKERPACTPSAPPARA